MIWTLFIVLILFLLFLDLGVFHRKDHEISAKQSLIWTAVWIFLALLFGVAIYYIYKYNWLGINIQGTEPYLAMLQYYTGYAVEKSLSLDNIFVIAIIFSYFKIPARYQHNILFWGVLGAIVFRGIMIFLGASIILKFHWSTYILGGVLIYSAIRMMTVRHDNVNYYKNPALKPLELLYPIKWDHISSAYFIEQDGRKYATVSMAALVVIEFTDILFAIDSIPAIFAITTDPFIVFTSNIFAILGLRNLYFFLANILDRFRYMKFSLVFILIFVGIKIGLSNHYNFPTFVSLSFIMVSLITGIIASLLSGKNDTAKLDKPV